MSRPRRVSKLDKSLDLTAASLAAANKNAEAMVAALTKKEGTTTVALPGGKKTRSPNGRLRKEAPNGAVAAAAASSSAAPEAGSLALSKKPSAADSEDGQPELVGGDEEEPEEEGDPTRALHKQGPNLLTELTASEKNMRVCDENDPIANLDGILGQNRDPDACRKFALESLVNYQAKSGVGGMKAAKAEEILR